MEYIDTLKEEETKYVDTLIQRLDPSSSYPIKYTKQDTIKYIKKLMLVYNNSKQTSPATTNTTRLQLLWYVNSKQLYSQEIAHVLKGEELLIADGIETYIVPSWSNIEDMLFSKNMMYMDIITKNNFILHVPKNPYKYITFDNNTVIVEFRLLL
jgi:hypothetical protein